jgi:hypothetical protein
MELYGPFGKSVQRLDSIEAAYHYAIFGGKVQRGGFPSLRQEYERIALAWLHRADLVLRYEDLRSPEAETIVLDGLRKLFTDKLPDDAAARVKAGLDPKVSASYSPNRVTPPDLPLQDIIEALMPGIRKALGYDQERKLCL